MRSLMTVVVLLALLTIPMMAATTDTGGGVSKVTVVTVTNASSTSSPTFVQTTGAVVHITVPGGTTQLVRASSTAESQCDGPIPGNGSAKCLRAECNETNREGKQLTEELSWAHRKGG